MPKAMRVPPPQGVTAAPARCASDMTALTASTVAGRTATEGETPSMA